MPWRASSDSSEGTFAAAAQSISAASSGSRKPATVWWIGSRWWTRSSGSGGMAAARYRPPVSCPFPPIAGGPHATTGEAVVRLLEQYGTDTVFGIPGVHTLEIYRGLASSDIRHVAPRHEQGAGFMADAYARIAGKPGVCVLITGAGLSNAATPVAGAFHDSIPMLVVSSDTHAATAGAGRPAPRPARPAGVHAHHHGGVDRRHRPGRAARGVRPGLRGVRVAPSAAGAHRDPDRRARPAARRGSDRLPARGARPVADDAAIARAAAVLRDATAPVWCSAAARSAPRDEAVAVAERIGAAIVTTLNGKGACPTATSCRSAR